MIAITLSTIATLLGSQWRSTHTLSHEFKVSGISIDTRQLNTGDLFIAIKGEQFDGHDFVAQAIEKGAAAVIVSSPLPTTACPQLCVADTRLALGKLGGWVRQQTAAIMVALTGSSGKTSVKEMTATILSRCGSVLATAGNLNNEIGVPLTLLRLTAQHRFAVIELGANHLGEIDYTAGLVKPDIALVNNLAAAHLAGFKTVAGVAKAKGEIFNHLTPSGCAIINLDSADEIQWQAGLQSHKVWRFAVERQPKADFFATNIILTVQGTQFVLHTPQGEVAVPLPLYGKHTIANALAAAALTMAAGVPLREIAQGLAEVKAIRGRLFPIWLAPTVLLLDDSYNANVGSMHAAVETLAAMPGYRIMVVGDMAELGEEEIGCHQQIGDALKRTTVDHVCSVGELSQHISLASGKGVHFPNKERLIVHLNHLISQHACVSVLVKGSRSAAMEQVVQSLQEAKSC